MNFPAHRRLAFVAGLFSVLLIAGCANKERVALDQARSKAAATNTPWQIQYVDRNGDTVAMVVRPSVDGQPQQVETMITPPPPGPAPHRTDPVLMQVGVEK